MSRLNEGLSIDQLGGGTEEMTEKLELFRLEADGMTDISFGLMMDEMGSQMITNQIEEWKIALGDMMGTAILQFLFVCLLIFVPQFSKHL